jgi:histidine triad (HIT) family protein
MQDCIFCAIGAGRQPAERILETPKILAFLDIAPVNYGHTLVIPKDHYQNLLDLRTTSGWRWALSAAVAQGLRTVLYAQGFNLSMNNFEAAGQVVFHAHVHVIPRYFTDGLQLFPQENYRPGDLAKTGAQLRQALEKT